MNERLLASCSKKVHLIENVFVENRAVWKIARAGTGYHRGERHVNARRSRQPTGTAVGYPTGRRRPRGL